MIAGVEVFRLVVGLVMLGIIFSLGSALFHLMTDKGDSKKMVRALTVRVVLSVVLFLALMAAWAAGLIEPHATVWWHTLGPGVANPMQQQ